MDLRPELQLSTLIRAMQQVVLPAVDPRNAAATEQGALVLATLSMMQQRQRLTYRYDRDELIRYVELAAALAAHLGGSAETREALSAAAAAGADTLARARAEPDELVERSRALRALVGELAAKLPELDVEGDSTLSALIMAAAKTQTSRERAWLLPTGFDADSRHLLPIEDQLGDAMRRLDRSDAERDLGGT